MECNFKGTEAVCVKKGIVMKTSSLVFLSQLSEIEKSFSEPPKSHSPHPWHFLGMVFVSCNRKKEVKKTSRDRRHLLYYLATSCEEIFSSNNKEHIKWVIRGRTVFLFWLNLDTQSLRILRKFYLPCPALLLVM